MTRRTLLKFLVHSIGALVAAVVVLPALLVGISPALRRSAAERWRDLGALEQFPVGTIRHAIIDLGGDDRVHALTAQGVYVWRPHADELVVFSRSCTDLGCPVVFDAGSACFFCPCHGGIFRQDGQRLAGPPNRPLDRYAVRVRDGTVQVDMRSVPPMI